MSPCLGYDLERTFVWEQMVGQLLQTSMDNNNDLLIQSFPKSAETFVFQLTVSYKTYTFSKYVTIRTRLEPITTSAFITRQTKNMVEIDTETYDPENVETPVNFIWTCAPDVDNNDCGQAIEGALIRATMENRKSVTLDIGSTVRTAITVVVITNILDRESVAMVKVNKVPGAEVIPPIISKLDISPNRDEIGRGELLTIRLDVSPKDAYMNWTLNNDPIPEALLGLMNRQQQTSLVVDTSFLQEGTINVFKFIAEKDGVYSSFKHMVYINVPPVCPCTFSPLSGIALETDFVFQCSNCQNMGNSLNFTFGLIDDKTGTKIPLSVHGATFSTKLPAPTVPGNPIQVYAEIIDTRTHSVVALRKQSINVETVRLFDLGDVEAKQRGWITLSRQISGDDLSTALYNAAIVSRTFNAMKAFTISEMNTNLDQTDKCHGRGMFNVLTQECDCLDGYVKADCSMDKETFELSVKMNDGLARNVKAIWDLTNKMEPISLSKLYIQLLSIDAVLERSDEVSPFALQTIIFVMKELMDMTSRSTKLRASPKLMLPIVNSMYASIKHHRAPHAPHYPQESPEHSSQYPQESPKPHHSEDHPPHDSPHPEHSENLPEYPPQESPKPQHSQIPSSPEHSHNPPSPDNPPQFRKASVLFRSQDVNLDNVLAVMDSVTNLLAKNQIEGMNNLVIDTEFYRSVFNTFKAMSYPNLVFDLPHNADILFGITQDSKLIFPTKTTITKLSRRETVPLVVSLFSNELWRNVRTQSEYNYTDAKGIFVKDLTSTHILSEAVMDARIFAETDQISITEPVSFVIGLKHPIKAEEFEQQILISNVTTPDPTGKIFHHKMVTSYKTYSCNSLIDGSWVNDKCILVNQFNTSSAICKCNVLSKVMVTETISEKTFIFTSNDKSQPLPAPSPSPTSNDGNNFVGEGSDATNANKVGGFGCDQTCVIAILSVLGASCFILTCGVCCALLGFAVYIKRKKRSNAVASVGKEMELTIRHAASSFANSFRRRPYGVQKDSINFGDVFGQQDDDEIKF